MCAYRSSARTRNQTPNKSARETRTRVIMRLFPFARDLVGMLPGQPEISKSIAIAMRKSRLRTDSMPCTVSLRYVYKSRQPKQTRTRNIHGEKERFQTSISLIRKTNFQQDRLLVRKHFHALPSELNFPSYEILTIPAVLYVLLHVAITDRSSRRHRRLRDPIACSLPRIPFLHHRNGFSPLLSLLFIRRHYHQARARAHRRRRTRIRGHDVCSMFTRRRKRGVIRCRGTFHDFHDSSSSWMFLGERSTSDRSPRGLVISSL